MTMQELIEKLKMFPPSLTVYVSEDAEGNSYSEFGRVELCHTMGEGRRLQVLADEDVDEYIANSEAVVDRAVIFPC